MKWNERMFVCKYQQITKHTHAPIAQNINHRNASMRVCVPIQMWYMNKITRVFTLHIKCWFGVCFFRHSYKTVVIRNGWPRDLPSTNQPIIKQTKWIDGQTHCHLIITTSSIDICTCARLPQNAVRIRELCSWAARAQEFWGANMGANKVSKFLFIYLFIYFVSCVLYFHVLFRNLIQLWLCLWLWLCLFGFSRFAWVFPHFQFTFLVSS